MVGFQQEQVIFKKVALSEKKMIFREIATENLQISVKGSQQEEMFHLVAIQTEKDEVLLCHHTADSKSVNQDQKVLANFAFKSERYFFHSELNFNLGWAILKIEGDLFQLQRRANARIDIPPTYDAVFILSTHQGANYFLDCHIKDISAGGLKLVLPSTAPDLKIGDKLKGSLRLGNRRPMEYEVEVRFAQRKEEAGVVTQIAGVQFLNRDHAMENRLLNLMMDLQRELFLKFPQR